MNDARPQDGEEPRSMTTVELAARARTRGASEFSALYERLSPMLYAWTELRLGRRSASEIEDVLQEVWLRALDSIVRWEPEGASFRGWLFAIAKNVLYERMRRSARDGFAPRAGDGEGMSRELEELSDGVTSISTRLSRDESVAHLVGWANELDPIDRKLLLHCGFEDLTCIEAATRIGVSAEAATKRWQRLRARLRASPSFAALMCDVAV
jgi:RNA polymerase sigma-70 factor (ECF subfamily)